MPGVTYERGVQFTPHGPVAMHVVHGAAPGRPLRARVRCSRTSRSWASSSVTAMQKRLSATATDGRHQRRLLRRTGRPERRADARRRRREPAVRRPLEHRGHAGRRARRPPGRVLRHLARARPAARVTDLNQAPDRTASRSSPRATAPATPAQSGVTERSSLRSRRRRPNTDLTGPVVQVAGAGGTPIPQDGAVLVARGTAAARLAGRRPFGTSVTLRMIFRPEWTGITDAVGGGPVLVRNGGPVFRAQRGLHVQSARAAESPHRRRPARGRPDPHGRRRRPPPRLQRRDDELRARADAGHGSAR